MSAIWTVLRKEFLENLRDRRSVGAALVFGPIFVPLLFAGMMSFALRHSAAQSDVPLRLAVAHAERAPNLVSHLAQYGVNVVVVE
ncbi:MAG: ABC transporter permease, partial [Steroidobacteraceae bacterium]